MPLWTPHCSGRGAGDGGTKAAATHKARILQASRGIYIRPCMIQIIFLFLHPHYQSNFNNQQTLPLQPLFKTPLPTKLSSQWLATVAALVPLLATAALAALAPAAANKLPGIHTK
ncbi:hypothetical protein BKA59DRAFT_485169 [Fusarium tricinctum]|uniref:Uncharacterized protein n=1 Tax=Fusarium tricinctum TaxID=61284 RepID=A0A8K0RMP2_9HYPO|nr:hypothetical protein BKA59DRAFT_485169 [Fusarium tricinctum]